MQPEGTPETADGLATSEEVAHAVQGLTDADYGRLIEAARIKMGGSLYTNPRDLVNDAVLSPYEAALGQGGRRWPKNVAFMAFLFMTIQGLASDSRGSAQRRLTTSNLRPGREGHRDHDLFDSPEFASSSPQQLALDAEHQARRQREVNKINDHFKNDPEVQWVMMGIEDGRSASEIQELAGMTKTQYESARSRWRRALKRLVSERRQS